MEEPSYLGAIQAFSMYEPQFCSVPLTEKGIDLNMFSKTIATHKTKLAYLVPNFQNPSGISYSEQRRQQVADLAIANQILLVEDDPYGSIKFTNAKPKNLYYFAPNNTLLLGTFSKTVAPGFRIGWIVAPTKLIYNKLVTAKQAADLHSDIFSQNIISTFLSEYDIDKHIQKIIQAYHLQSEVMMNTMSEFFPKEATYTKPLGGMFSWVNMNEGFSSMKLFNEAIKQKVAIVPGVPFYLNKTDTNTFRLNFSCSTPMEIKEGIKRLANAIKQVS